MFPRLQYRTGRGSTLYLSFFQGPTVHHVVEDDAIQNAPER